MAQDPPPSVLKLRLLGGPVIELGGRPIHLETAKTFALLVYLVVRQGWHQREALAGMFWGDQTPAKAARGLRRALWNIRQSLCPDQEKTCVFLNVTRRAVAFNPQSPYWLDLEAFDKHLHLAREYLNEAKTRGRADQAIEHLDACARLYRGDFLEGVYLADAPDFELWMLGIRAYYREKILQGLFRLGKLRMSRGEYEEAILTWRQLLGLEPWSEWAHRQLMLCYALTGRRADALAQFEQCRQALKTGLQVDPMPETLRLYERLRDPQQFSRWLASFSAREPSDSAPELPPIPFVGRAREHARLLSYWEERRDALVLVEGEAGIGKTRLVTEVLRLLEAQGVLVLQGSCYPFGGALPYHPIAEALRDAWQRHPAAFDALPQVWLTELARLLPQLLTAYPHLPPPVPIERSVTARQRLFEAVAQALLSLRHPHLVFFLDDIHWADRDTVDMFRYLLHRLRGTGIWFVVAYRAEELFPGHPFRLLRSELGQAQRLVTLQLHPLPESSVQKMLARWGGLSELQVQTLAAYFHHTFQGNPFMLTEGVRDLVEQGLLWWEQGEWHVDARWLSQIRYHPRLGIHARKPYAPVPASVRHMILARVERLPASAQKLLQIISVWGEPATRAFLAEMLEMEEIEMEEGLALCETRGLVRTIPSGPVIRYDIAHPLIRQAIYEHLPPAMRRQLHGHIAAILEKRSRDRDEQLMEALAYHFGESGQSTQAIHYLLRAGAHAMERQALASAVYFYSRALKLLPAEDLEGRFQALSGRERAYNQLAQREAQAQDLDMLWELAEQLGRRDWQADILYRRAEWALRTARFREGIADARRAYQLAMAAGETGIAIDALRMESQCHVRMGEQTRARERCEAGLALARKIGDERREVLCLGALGVIAMDLDQRAEAQALMEQALAYWRETNEGWHLAIAGNNLSMLYHRVGKYGQALALLQEVRDLAPRTGDLGLDAYSLTSLGVVYATIGRYEEALTCYAQAEELASIISDQGLIAYLHACRGEVYLEREEFDAAEAAFRQAYAMEEAMGIAFSLPQIWEGLSRCAMSREDWDEARQYLENAASYYQQHDTAGAEVTFALLAFLDARQGRQEQAREWLQQFRGQIGQGTCDKVDPEPWWWVVRAEQALGEVAQARRDLQRACACIQERAQTLQGEDRTSYLTRHGTRRAMLAGCYENRMIAGC